MFWILPSLLLITIAFAGVVVIAWRKFPYLRRLAPEAHEVGETVWHDLFPELFAWYRKIPFQHMREARLRETEKLLRKIRLMFSKIDRVSNSMIHQVRREQINQQSDDSETNPAITDMYAHPKTEVDIMEEFKKDEQRLIIEIAKTPKDSELYSKLGDVYMSMSNFIDAKESFEAAMELNPDNISLRQKLSAALQKIAQIPVS